MQAHDILNDNARSFVVAFADRLHTTRHMFTVAARANRASRRFRRHRHRVLFYPFCANLFRLEARRSRIPWLIRAQQCVYIGVRHDPHSVHRDVVATGLSA